MARGANAEKEPSSSGKASVNWAGRFVLSCANFPQTFVIEKLKRLLVLLAFFLNIFGF